MYPLTLSHIYIPSNTSTPCNPDCHPCQALSNTSTYLLIYISSNTYPLIHQRPVTQSAARAISCTLGWGHIVRLSHTRKTDLFQKINRYGKARQSTMEILMQIDDDVLDLIKYHLRHELVLYAYALSLILEQYKSIMTGSTNDARQHKLP